MIFPVTHKLLWKIKHTLVIAGDSGVRRLDTEDPKFTLGGIEDSRRVANGTTPIWDDPGKYRGIYFYWPKC